MPMLTIEGFGTFDVDAGRRLVLAIEECGFDIGHRCGGFARCTTCRVEFLAGEPEAMTRAEAERLATGGMLGKVRLSCQCRVADGMAVRPLVRVAEQPWTDPGPPPAAEITPEPEWTTRSAAGA
jgi:ferredoxin